MNAHRKLIRRTALVAALVAASGAAALVLAACGDGGGHDMGAMESSSSPSADASAGGSAEAGDHNAADVSFSKEMIQHHPSGGGDGRAGRQPGIRATGGGVVELLSGRLPKFFGG